MANNFGAEIRKVLKEKGMTVSEFARRINKSRENAYDIFRRKSLDTDLLSIISQVLDYDFLSKSGERKQRNIIIAEPRPPYGNSSEELMLMREELFILRKEIVELRKRITELEKSRKSRKK
jgi:transcriptional regulator with XRE-family HTH domain